MDELLRTPQSARRPRTHVRGRRASDNRIKKFVETCGEYAHKAETYLREKPVHPGLFLLVAALLCTVTITATVFDTGYAVTVDGETLGVLHSVEEYERAVASVEARASRILGYDYEVVCEASFEKILNGRDEFVTAGSIEGFLFGHVGEIVAGYDLMVSGEVIGSADDKAALEALLDEIAAPYMSENTVSYGFVEDVKITGSYITSESNLDLDGMYATLTENTTGETTYTVVAGDTYSEIAYDNDMTLSELFTLNPQANIDRLMIGDVLNVKRIIPFLSVYTIESETYEAEISSPIEYVSDSTIYQGDTKVVTQGTAGLAMVTADVTYVNGYETERTVVESTTLVEPTVTVVAVGTAERPKTASTGKYIWPTSGTVTSKYGYRYIFGSYSFHSGIDIANRKGTNIVAADGGKVTYAGWMSGYGYLVVITHDNGNQTYYGHCSQILVSVGERVYQGEHIAEMGSTGRSTGVHLHFEIRINGSTVNPLNYI